MINVEKLKIGIIGMGSIANSAHIPAYLLEKRAEIVAVCDIIEERAQKARQKHFKNARVYTDYFLMTANPSIVKEVGAVFDVIKRPYEQQKFKNLLVSPFNMRESFCSLIDDEIRNAR